MAGPTASRGARVAGTLLVLCGVIGLVAGVVPFAVNALRLLGSGLGRAPEDWAAHGVEAMGLSTEWALLSSADGAFLGALLLAAGIGWRRGRSWAPLVTLLYAIDGLLVTGVDLAVFAAKARPGPVRASMLVLDGIAFAVAAATMIGLIIWWLTSRSRST